MAPSRALGRYGQPEANTTPQGLPDMTEDQLIAAKGGLCRSHRGPCPCGGLMTREDERPANYWHELERRQRVLAAQTLAAEAAAELEPSR
jgi:hypothetical protein